MGGLKAFREDRARYPLKSWATDPCLWSIAAYRFAQEIDNRCPIFPLKVIALVFQLIAYAVSGNELPSTAEVGPGLCIMHGNGVILHEQVKIGANATIRQGVTVGIRHQGGPTPIIGDNVDFGAYAQVFGGVTVGDGAKLGAMAVVLRDVPPGATAVGNPARIIPAKDC